MIHTSWYPNLQKSEVELHNIVTINVTKNMKEHHFSVHVSPSILE